mgnify:FL=1
MLASIGECLGGLGEIKGWDGHVKHGGIGSLGLSESGVDGLPAIEADQISVEAKRLKSLIDAKKISNDMTNGIKTGIVGNVKRFDGGRGWKEEGEENGR